MTVQLSFALHFQHSVQLSASYGEVMEQLDLCTMQLEIAFMQEQHPGNCDLDFSHFVSAVEHTFPMETCNAVLHAA